MTELRLGPDLVVPEDAVTQTFLILGKRGSGKTNTAVVLAEEMHRAGAPFVVLDPIGAWWGLKSSFDGAGVGLPVYVFGGQHGDLPLQPTAGQLMAQVFIRHRQPMVLDMKGWTGADRARFVTAFAKWLLDHNDRVPSHVFLEEADAFIPQRPYKGEEEMLGAMDRLIRWGRQDGLGSSTVSQRSAKINKDVTTQTEILIAHRTTGPQDRDVVRDWIKYHAGDERMHEILASLAKLPDGTAWVWSPEWLGLLSQVAFRRRDTFDSAGTPKLGEKRVQPKELAPVDLDRLRDQLADTIEKAKAEDPKELRRQIVTLERQLAAVAATPPPQPEVRVERVEVPALDGQVEHLIAVAVTLQNVGSEITKVGVEIVSAIDRVNAASRSAPQSSGFWTRPTRAEGRTGTPTLARPETGPREASGTSVVTRPPTGTRQSVPVEHGEVRLKAGARRMLSALAMLHPTPLSRGQMATLSDISPTSGTFTDYLSAIRMADLIVEAGVGDAKTFALSELGQAMKADELRQGAPSSAELVAMWSRKLKLGARRMLAVLYEVHPDGLTRADLGERAEISSTSGTFTDYLSMLRRNGLLDESTGALRAGDALFLGEAR